jgi:hypothetical protein
MCVIVKHAQSCLTKKLNDLYKKTSGTRTKDYNVKCKRDGSPVFAKAMPGTATFVRMRRRKNDFKKAPWLPSQKRQAQEPKMMTKN